MEDAGDERNTILTLAECGDSETGEIKSKEAAAQMAMARLDKHTRLQMARDEISVIEVDWSKRRYKRLIVMLKNKYYRIRHSPINPDKIQRCANITLRFA